MAQIQHMITFAIILIILKVPVNIFPQSRKTHDSGINTAIFCSISGKSAEGINAPETNIITSVRRKSNVISANILSEIARIVCAIKTVLNIAANISIIPITARAASISPVIIAKAWAAAGENADIMTQHNMAVNVTTKNIKDTPKVLLKAAATGGIPFLENARLRDLFSFLRRCMHETDENIISRTIAVQK